MASTFTTRLAIEKPGTGEQDGTWGSTLNDNFDEIDEALAGYLGKSIAGGAQTTTLTDAEARNPVIELTGTITGNQTVVVPTREGVWDFVNATDGDFTVTVKTSAGTGIQVPAGGAARLYCDATNVEQILTTTDTGIANVVEDTTPDLGGALNTNDFSIDLSEGSAVASASTADIWVEDGNTVHVTGTTQINSFGTAARAGAIRQVIFDDALTLNNNSNIILPGDNDIDTEAGDCAIVYAETTTIARVLCYTKADGTAVVDNTVSAASQAQQETGSSTSVYVNPGRQQYHQSAVKAWALGDGTGTVAVLGSYNIGGITDNGTGDYSFSFQATFGSANYAVGGSADTAVFATNALMRNASATGSLRVRASNQQTALDLNPAFLVSGDLA